MLTMLRHGSSLFTEGVNEAGIECAEGEEGEIWMTGPSKAMGYYNRPELSERTFNAKLSGSSLLYLRTGDIGFVRNGYLYVTGRCKVW